MSTQQSMVEDLQALNEQLGKAKKEVEQANEARQVFSTTSATKCALPSTE